MISSQIEATRTTLLDLLAFEAEDPPAANADIKEATNELDALNYSFTQTERVQEKTRQVCCASKVPCLLSNGAEGNPEAR